VIVDPDFLDHWRTRMLVDALGGDEFAPFYLLRLWGHCQARKATRFDIPAAGIKGLCKAPCDAEALERALIESGYVERDGASITVLKWAEKNAALISAWENGHRGGRPKKPDENPRVSDKKPMGSGHQTGLKPIDNPLITDSKPIGEDRSREEKKSPLTPLGGELPGFVLFWRAWPVSDRKQARGKCLEAWKKAKAEADAALIVAHVERMKAGPWQRDGGQFIPAPLTYLNQQRWQGAEGAADWWLSAGFADRFEAENAGCREHNASQFHGGKRDEVAA
jgi:hypothetical protein